MEVVIKVAALAAVSALMAIVIKRGTTEMSLVLEIAVCAAIAAIAVSLATPIAEVITKAKVMSGLSESILTPVIKCVFIGIISKIASDMCKDGGQGAVANAVELTGAIGALYVSLPLISTLLDMLGELL